MHHRVSLFITFLGSFTNILAYPQIPTTSADLLSIPTSSISFSTSTTTTSSATTSSAHLTDALSVPLPTSITSSLATPSEAPVATPNMDDTSAGQPKLVVAHVIVGNTQSYSTADWATDIATASDAGIDGFALNYGSLDWEAGQLSNAYAAAASHPTFKVFLNADMTSVSGNSQGDAQSLANQVKQFYSNPAQLTYNGKPILGTFSGEYSTFGTGSVNQGWELVKSLVGSPIIFLPAWFIDPSTYSSYSAIDGAMNWNGGWPSGGGDLTWDSDQSYVSGLAGKVFVAAVSPNFFTHYSPQTYNKNFIYRSDDNLLATRWEMLMQYRAEVAIAEIVTWNDFGESHYIGPIKGSESMANAWVDGFDHTDWLTMTTYYATAFKTGTYPVITKDQVYMYARPHPKDANASNDGVGRPTNWQWTDDNFYVVVLAKAAGNIVLSSPAPSTSTTASLLGQQGAQSFTVAPGINHFKLALTPGNGMRATLQRAGVTVVDVWPQSYTFNPNPQTYNFNAYVTMGSA